MEPKVCNLLHRLFLHPIVDSETRSLGVNNEVGQHCLCPVESLADADDVVEELVLAAGEQTTGRRQRDGALGSFTATRRSPKAACTSVSGRDSRRRRISKAVSPLALRYVTARAAEMDSGDTKMLSPGVIADICRYTSRAKATFAATNSPMDCASGFTTDDALVTDKTGSMAIVVWNSLKDIFTCPHGKSANPKAALTSKKLKIYVLV